MCGSPVHLVYSLERGNIKYALKCPNIKKEQLFWSEGNKATGLV
jgi:hypothetical protein